MRDIRACKANIIVFTSSNCCQTENYAKQLWEVSLDDTIIVKYYNTIILIIQTPLVHCYVKIKLRMSDVFMGRQSSLLCVLKILHREMVLCPHFPHSDAHFID